MYLMRVLLWNIILYRNINAMYGGGTACLSCESGFGHKIVTEDKKADKGSEEEDELDEEMVQYPKDIV